MKNTDTLLENARALITSTKLDENVDHIKSLVSTVKIGDSTNFGKVLEIGANSITFKAKDLPKTTIPFNARKMGSRDYVLDKLIKLKENKLEEVLDPNDDAGVWIDDFVKSDNPKFAGKSKEQRIKMALGAWYAAQKKESLGEETLKELYSIKTSAVRTLMAEFTSLDAVELEDFFKAAQAYFAKEGDEFDNDDFNDLSIIMDKAAKRWHNRATN